jgi:nucleoside phosphorylase
VKSDAHLAHPPWLAGLSDLVNVVIRDVQPQWIYSAGTAGGANTTERLGDVVVTNAAKLQLRDSNNTKKGLNGQTFSCTNWYPDLSLLPDVQSKLFFPLSKVATNVGLEHALEGAKRGKHADAEQLAPFQLSDLLNDALEPRSLDSPKAISMKDQPLLTTDYYFIAQGDTNYAVLEMDDAVIAHEALQRNTNFAFVRNVSDTLVPAQTPAGKPIPEPAREAWSSAIYDAYGLYTSFNGALATWAAIAAT